jgi:hypothetical protein
MLDDYAVIICCAIRGKNMKQLTICLGVLLSMCATVNAADTPPLLCPGKGQIAGNTALYDEPRGLLVGTLDPSIIYSSTERRVVAQATWYEVRRAEVPLGWVRGTTVERQSDLSCYLLWMRLTGEVCFPINAEFHAEPIRWNADWRKSLPAQFNRK